VDQTTEEQLKLAEVGLSPDPVAAAPAAGTLPPNAGTLPVPHHVEFVGLVNQFARAYRWTFDEALKHSRQNAVAMRNDVVLMEALRERQTMTAQLGWHLEARDETDPAQMGAVRKLEKVIRLTPDWQGFLMQLLEAVWFGRYGVQCVYRWDQYEPDLLRMGAWSPVNGDSLVARWGPDWGIRVNAQFEGRSEYGGDGLGSVHWLTPAEREVIVVHQHEREAADYFDINGAGAVKGVGLRGRLYWFWWLKSQFLAQWADYIERFANGVWIGYYDQSNPQAKTSLEDAVAGYKANRLLTFPRTMDGRTAYGLEIREVGAASSSILRDSINYFDSAMRRLILGLAMADGMEVGVGGDGADLITSKVSRTVKYDANNLAETLTREWIPLLAKYNCPGVPPPRFHFDTDHPNAANLIQYATQIAQLGGGVDLAQLQNAAGLARPSPGDPTLSKLQPMTAVGVGAVPEGVPSMGTPGPEPAADTTSADPTATQVDTSPSPI
jgi:hypothetical protein